MQEPKEITLPSGAILKIQVSPFADSNALLKSLLNELKTVEMTSAQDMGNIVKNLLCLGFSSPVVEACLKKCMDRCLYNDLKIDAKTFEPIETRQDYMSVCVAVAQENIDPFMKSLYADYRRAMSMIASTQA